MPIRHIHDGTYQGRNSRAACNAATVASRSRKLVGPTPLPAGPGENLPDRLNEAMVGIADGEHHL